MTNPIRGRADFLDLGDWNAVCSMCGRKRKGSWLVQNWQGMWRCPEHNEARNPQDFLRPVVDNQLPPFVQLRTMLFQGVCDPNSITALSDYATADCAIVDYRSPAFNPDIEPGE